MSRLLPSHADRGQRHRRVGRQVQSARRDPGGDQVRAERGDHRAVVGAQLRPRAPAPGCRACSARCSASARSRELAATPPPMTRVSTPLLPAGVDRLAGQHVADRLLEATRPRRRPAPARRPADGPRPSGPPRSSGRRTRSRTGARPGPSRRSGRAGRRSRPGRRPGPPGRWAGRRGTAARAAGRPCRTPRRPRRRWSRPSGVTPRARSSTSSSDEWPPETSSAIAGSGSGPCSRVSTATCAARWLTP